MNWLKKIWNMLDIKRNFIIYECSIDNDIKTLKEILKENEKCI